MAAVSIEVRGKTFAQAVREFECNLIALAVAEAAGNKTEAARRLGIDRGVIHARLARATVRYSAVVE